MTYYDFCDSRVVKVSKRVVCPNLSCKAEVGHHCFTLNGKPGVHPVRRLLAVSRN